eukprot:TRINITY_DN285_c0_g1_i1.p1 TRINITY_DN285_c0_g1~~TRINITY_DN285_c0_g1_i1.p1  ORF type:complete len:168 (+),score=63.50 TRINITY_DN285_c0_g1_i1:188-691(+)
MEREPCPQRIWGDVGGAFAMGCIGGSLWHGYKGARNAPAGDKFVGSIMAIRGRAPTVGGNFAVWGGLFSTFDCALAAYRHKEDIWNPVGSGFLTGAVLAARGGFKASMRSGIAGGILLALIEGAAHLLGKVAESRMMVDPYAAPPPPPPAEKKNELLTDKDLKRQIA